MDDTAALNSKLEEYYWSKWPEIVAGLRKREGLSPPHLIKLNNRYSSARHRLLIVGQQTRLWNVENPRPSCSREDFSHLLDCYARWDLAGNDPLKSSPFWQAAYCLAELLDPQKQECDPRWFAWSNLIKTDRNGKCPSREDQDWICGFHLLQKEIEVLDPKVVVFFIGPDYCWRLEKTFAGAVFQEISARNLWSKVSHPDLPPLSYLTYHPGFLRRKPERWKVISDIAADSQSRLHS